MKGLRILCCWCWLALLTAGCGASSPATIRIGGGFNLTGGLSALDVPAANGANLAVNEINASGGVLGRQLELRIADGKTDVPTIRTSVEQLIARDKVVALVGYTDSDSLIAAGGAAKPSSTPFIGVGATSPSLPQQVGPHTFLACFGDNVQAAAGAQFAYQTLNYRRGYLLWDTGTEYTRLLAKYFKQSWAALPDTTLLGDDTYQFKDIDHSAQIARLKALAQPPEFLYIAANPDDIGPLVKELRAAGIAQPIVGGDGYDTPDLLRIAGGSADQVFFTTHTLVAGPGTPPAVVKFSAAYQAQYGTAPENAFAALGYDSVYLLADAIKRAGSTAPAAIIAALEATKQFPGITGQINFAPGDHVPQKEVTIIAVRGGLFTLGGQVIPDQVPAPER